MQGFSTHFCSLKNLTSNKKIMHTCNQINRELYVWINK